jgi:ActR/RegA family two-component response regulator
LDEIYVIDRDLAALMQLTAALNRMRVNVTAVQSEEELAVARRLAARRPAAIVIALNGDESVVDIRALLEDGAATRVVLLAPTMPPRAALARVASAGGATILDKEGPAIVTVATLVAMLTRHGNIA